MLHEGGTAAKRGLWADARDDQEVSGAEWCIRRGFAVCGARVHIYDPIVVVRSGYISLADDVRLDSFAKLEGGCGLMIGRYVHIASFAHLNIGGGTLHLAEGSAVASGGKIITGSNRVDGLSLSANAPDAQQVVTRGRVIVGRNAAILTNAVVLPDVTIGEGAIVAAGAVVTHDVPPWTIVAGVPARIVGQRPRHG